MRSIAPLSPRSTAAAFDSQPAGTPLSKCYPDPSPVGKMLRMPEIHGIIRSLVGADPLFDHQAVHVRQPNEGKAQGLHGDSIIDMRMHFDIQLMYFPHDVPLEMGRNHAAAGEPFPPRQRARRRPLPELPRTAAHGLQGRHPGGSSTTASGTAGGKTRPTASATCYKIRLNPAVRQLRLWNTDDLDEGGNPGNHLRRFEPQEGQHSDDPQHAGALVRGGRRTPRDRQQDQAVAVSDGRREFPTPTTG